MLIIEVGVFCVVWVYSFRGALAEVQGEDGTASQMTMDAISF